MKQLLWVVVGCVLLAGCSAAEEDPEPAFAPTPKPWGSEYVTATFDPPFTAMLVPGWTVVERDAGQAQIYKPCDTCPQKGVENGAITLDMSLAEDSPQQAIAELAKAKGITADNPVDTQLGYLAGMQFNAGRAGAVRFPGGYRSEAKGGPITVFTTAAQGRTVTLFIDPHTAEGDALAEFTATALRIATNIRFEE
jgi:hypothetical protein